MTGTGGGWGNIIGSLLSGLLGGGAAQGEIFNYGRIHPFARGIIVPGPTIFPMAEGYGLMGEKGFEAGRANSKKFHLLSKSEDQ